jgi:hypothetical protein
MDIEQLKLILETLRTMGEAGKDAFIWWILLDKALPVLAWLLTFCGLIWLVLRIVGAISSDSHMARLRDDLGVGRPGELINSEVAEVRRRISELVAAETANKAADRTKNS